MFIIKAEREGAVCYYAGSMGTVFGNIPSWTVEKEDAVAFRTKAKARKEVASFTATTKNMEIVSD